MTLHLRALPPKPLRVKADTRALAEARKNKHRDLRLELEEEKISAQLVAERNAKNKTPYYLND